MVKIALGDQISEVIFVTDSTIAMSWCSWYDATKIICV